MSEPAQDSSCDVTSGPIPDHVAYPNKYYVRKFAYVPLRLDGNVVFFKYFYENLEGNRISQHSFLVERLRGNAKLYHQENMVKRSYFPKEKVKI